ncbi:MAG: hypothetical protein FJW69_08395 [Actinobacteria bacterium]|nr:hypothetical protein [Actinomycetota bacterium]MBM3713043.1 hypothetical protein [Actinomycetota bacterium]
MNILRNYSYNPKIKSCSIKCKGFTCPEWNYCNGCFSPIKDNNDNILCLVPLPIQYYDDFKKKNNISEDDNSSDIIKEVDQKMENNGYIKKEEVLMILKNDYQIRIKERTLKYYASQRIIEPSAVGRLPGVTGSVSYYKENTPELIFLIKFLQDFYRLKLEEIKANFFLLKIENIEELEKLRKLQNSLYDQEKKEKSIKYGNLEIFYIENPDVSKLYSFQAVAWARALLELGLLKKKIIHSGKGIEIIKKSSKDYEVNVKFGEPINKIVVFRKKGEIFIK